METLDNLRTAHAKSETEPITGETRHGEGAHRRLAGVRALICMIPVPSLIRFILREFAAPVTLRATNAAISFVGAAVTPGSGQRSTFGFPGCGRSVALGRLG